MVRHAGRAGAAEDQAERRGDEGDAGRPAAGPGPLERRILRVPEVMRLVGLSRTTIWRAERLGQFPARRRLSANTVGWLSDDIAYWIDSRRPGRGA